MPAASSAPDDTGGASGCADAPLEQASVAEIAAELAADIAGEDSNRFVPLVEPAMAAALEGVVEALLAGDRGGVVCELEALSDRGVRYGVAEVTDATGPGATYALMETVAVDHDDFKGWGSALLRPAATGRRIYQAPHPGADWHTEQITLDAFLRDHNARVALFAGAHRGANTDTDGDGWPESDATHDTETLFHELTRSLVDEGVAQDSPYWIIQLHGSRNRDGPPDVNEPTIVASNGADIPAHTSSGPLVRVAAEVTRPTGAVSMGVCGWDEASAPLDEKDNKVELTGDYTLCATANVQGDLLEAGGQREAFMHFEIERSARESYQAETGPGYQGILDLMDALANLPPIPSP